MQYIKLLLQYGGEAMVATPETVYSKLEIAENGALRIVTGVVK